MSNPIDPTNDQSTALSNRHNTESQQKLLNDQNFQTPKPYFTPQLEELGDLRALTFGSFVGALDSGGLGSFISP